MLSRQPVRRRVLIRRVSRVYLPKNLQSRLRKMVRPTRAIQRPNGRGHGVHHSKTFTGFRHPNGRGHRVQSRRRVGTSRVSRKMVPVAKPFIPTVHVPPAPIIPVAVEPTQPLPVVEKPFHIEDYNSNILDEFNPATVELCDLAQMGVEHVSKDVPVLQWPQALAPIFVVSLRVARYYDMLRRMKHWAPLLELVPATDGRKLPLERYRRMGRLGTMCISHGQLGCYESHVRVWQRIVDRNLPHAFVLEDDADVRYCPETVQRLNEMLTELESVPDWDIVYIGNISLHPFKQQRTEHLFEMTNWEGTFMYYISNRGARKFLTHAFPIRIPIDVYMGSQYGPQNMVPLALIPRLAHCVPSVSDTDRDTF